MMLRFFIMAWLWIVVSFALMWWVQLSVDRVHRGAVEAVERAMEAGRPPVLGARGGEAGVVVQPPAAGVEDLAALEYHRRQLMHRLRTMWISITLMPLLVAGWYISRLEVRIRELESMQGTRSPTDG